MRQLRHKVKSSAHRSEGASLATPGNYPPSAEESSPGIDRGTLTNRSSRRPVLTLIGVLASATLASADPGTGTASPNAKIAPSPSPYVVVSHLDETDQQISLKDGKLLAHRHATDPFGIAMSGKFKGLPLIVERPVTNPAKTNEPVQVPAVGNELTLEKAVQQLPIGAVNIDSHEALVGFRAVHEGDLLVLDLNRHQFVVWVESIDRRGVQFRDINLQQHATKPFRFGPNELPDDLAGRQTDVRDFLKQNGN
jgi:hypothetical protein